MSVPDRVVFDTKPLVAYADGEPGSETVTGYLDAIARGESSGTINVVNATEVRYILTRKYDRETADQFLDWLWMIGVTAVDAEPVWDTAAEYVIEYNPALGDSYALATATHVDGTVLVGGDSEYHEVDEVRIERFRTHGV